MVDDQLLTMITYIPWIWSMKLIMVDKRFIPMALMVNNDRSLFDNQAVIDDDEEQDDEDDYDDGG